MAVTASTVTTLIVFLPLVVGARTGLTTWLREVGVTISIALVCSLFSSLLLIPLMSAHFLKNKQTQPSRFLKWLEGKYASLLGWTLQHRVVTGSAQERLRRLARGLGHAAGKFALAAGSYRRRRVDPAPRGSGRLARPCRPDHLAGAQVARGDVGTGHVGTVTYFTTPPVRSKRLQLECPGGEDIFVVGKLGGGAGRRSDGNCRAKPLGGCKRCP